MFALYSGEAADGDDSGSSDPLANLLSGQAIYNDAVSRAMAGFGPDLCLFIILLFRLMQFFGAAMTGKWFFTESKQNREHLMNGMFIYAFCQIVCAIATLIAVVAWTSIGGWANIGVLGVGFVLPEFAYEFYCAYIWLKARQYSDLADAVEAQGVDFTKVPREFELDELQPGSAIDKSIN